MRREAHEVVADGKQAPFAKYCYPGAHGVGDGRVSGTRARPAFVGEHDQPGAGVVRVGSPLDVALRDELIDQLGCGLPGDVEVFGQLGDGRAASRKPGEGKAMRGPDVVEAT